MFDTFASGLVVGLALGVLIGSGFAALFTRGIPRGYQPRPSGKPDLREVRLPPGKLLR